MTESSSPVGQPAHGARGIRPRTLLLREPLSSLHLTGPSVASVPLAQGIGANGTRTARPLDGVD